MPPVPVAAGQSIGISEVQVHVAPLSPAGSISVTLMPAAGFGPALLIVTVYTTVPPGWGAAPWRLSVIVTEMSAGAQMSLVASRLYEARLTSFPGAPSVPPLVGILANMTCEVVPARPPVTKGWAVPPISAT